MLWSPFLAIFAKFRRKQLALFLKTNVEIAFFCTNSCFLSQNRKFFLHFFRWKLFEIITLVPYLNEFIFYSTSRCTYVYLYCRKPWWDFKTRSSVPKRMKLGFRATGWAFFPIFFLLPMYVHTYVCTYLCMYIHTYEELLTAPIVKSNHA
jgi:hypothetical protein